MKFYGRWYGWLVAPLLAGTVALAACSDENGPTSPEAFDDFGSLRASAGPVVVPNVEQLYLTDSGLDADDDGGVKLFLVELDDGANEADLTLLAELDSESGGNDWYDQVDALAATPDGELVVAIDKFSKRLGSYDVSTDVFTDHGVVSGLPNGVVQAAYGLDGMLYISSDDSDDLHVVDVSVPEVTSTIDLDDAFDMGGADIVFGADGTLYLYTNGGLPGDGPGLYEIADFATAVGSQPITPAFVGQPSSPFFTGLAIRDAGEGNLVGSTHTTGGGVSQVFTFSRTNGSQIGAFDTKLGGSDYDVGYGDMTVGLLKTLDVTVATALSGSFDRTYLWTIEKVGLDGPGGLLVEELTLQQSELYTVTYEIELAAAASDGSWTLSGTVEATNETPFDTDITAVSVSIDNSVGSAAVSGCSLPATLGEGATVTCDYEATLGSDPGTTSYTATGTVTAKFTGETDTEDFTDDSDPYQFGEPTNVYDEAVSVTDSWYGDLDLELMWSELDGSNPEFTYTRDLQYADAGDYTVENTASFETNDNQTTGSDDHTILVYVPGDQCVLTQGYWKTHSAMGPAPYDMEGWGVLADEHLTVWIEDFFDSGDRYDRTGDGDLTWYDAFWMPPKGGDGWLILAHQYMAAYLNIENGADDSMVSDEMDDAWDLLTTYAPGEVKGKDAKDFKELADYLAQYNEGSLNVPHCDENDSYEEE